MVELLPEFEGADRARVTVRQLLSHCSGLPAHRPFWRQAAEAPSERRAISLLAAREPLEYAPGTRAVYSDLGFIVLGWLLERVTGERLDVLARKQIAAPLALAATTFMSLSDPEARARVLGDRSIAATQLCAERHRVLIGEVDDLNAMAMGGVAGHAGLFSTAEELSRIAAALCRAWRGDDAGARRAGRPRRRAHVLVAVGRRGIRPGASAGTDRRRRIRRRGRGSRATASATSGFTGCSLWIDPARETWIVMLSNRVHPAVPKDDRFKRFRPMLHDVIADALDS